MAKDFFKNLPDTSTPLSASRLNGLLNGNEAMESIVVEDIKCKNLLSDTMIIKIVNCSGTTKKIIQTSADTSNNLNWKIQTYLDDTTTSNPLTILNNEVGNISLTFKKFSTFNRVGFGLNGETKDTLIVFDATSLEDNKDYVISFELTDATQGSITIENIQLEEGVISTKYVPYKKFGYSSTETMGNIVVDDIKCKNLLNINARPYKTNYCDAIVSGDTLTTSGAGDNYVTYLINVKQNTDYTISVNSMNSGINIYDAEVSNYIAGFEIANGSSLTFNTGSHSKINIVFYGNDTYVKPQLEEGTTATDFVQAKEFSVTTSPIQLTFNDNYVYSSDRQYNCFRIGKMVFLQIYHMAFKSSPEHGEYIIYGLPKPVNGSNIFCLYGGNLAKGDTCRCYQSWDTGDILVYYGSPSHTGDSANNQYAGILIYETRE